MIIGRTRVNAEVDKLNLAKGKYYFISHLARDFILKNNISSLPVCLRDVVKNNNWRTFSYSTLRKLGIREFDKIMDANSGFTERTPKGEYRIYFDDQQPITTQRFTISHEIGHILLNHFNRPLESREKEANMFAARLLMPMCVLFECDVKSPAEIQKLCRVSNISAQFRFQRLKMLKERNKFYTDRNEEKIKNAFADFINEQKRLKGLLN